MKRLIPKVRKHCLLILTKSQCDNLPFHNCEHTLAVYRNTKIIGRYEKLTKIEMEPLLIAALFHDTGNALSYIGHEGLSAVLARLFLEKQGYCEDKISQVVKCIGATTLPQKPMNQYESILCDADLFHLGTKSFFRINKLLRKEWSQALNKNYSDKEWIFMNINFLRSHTYHTRYARLTLEPVKQKNIHIMESFVLQDIN